MVTFIAMVIAAYVIVNLNHAAMVRLIATETFLFLFLFLCWMHEASEHIVRILELAHVAHSALAIE